MRTGALCCVLPILLALLLLARSSRAKSPSDPIATALPSVVMVATADVREGVLTPIGSGSGTIVQSDGLVLTNRHTLVGKDGGYHDLFLIGRLSPGAHRPEFLCSGDPANGVHDAATDLSAIRCDRDADGAAFAPAGWPILPLRDTESSPLLVGEGIWVLGFPGTGDRSAQVTAGRITEVSASFVTTDAMIRHGNSGGAAIDEQGRLIGIPSAFRMRQTQRDNAITKERLGLIRPLHAAKPVLPSARPDSPAHVRGTLVGPGGDPVAGALVAVLLAGTDLSDRPLKSIANHALAWVHSDDRGAFSFEVSLPGQHQVVVIHPGFAPRILPRSNFGSTNPLGEISLQPLVPHTP